MFHYSLLLLILPVIVNAQCELGSVYNSDKNVCFTFYNASVDFQTAESICTVSSGHLASVHNIIDNNYLAKQAQQYISTNGYIWLGAKSSAPNPSDWNWSDGTPFDWQYWQSGEPSSLETTACMQFSAATSKWRTASCINYAPFICEYPPGEVAVTCPPSKSAHAQLSNEYNHGYVGYQHENYIIKSCPSEYYYLEETQKCYKVVIDRGYYDNARQGCLNDGADLVSIHSYTENAFIHDISQTGHDVWYDINEDQTNDIYIGLIYQNGYWQWTDGTSFDYSSWASGEPNNMNREFWTAYMPDAHTDSLRPNYNPNGLEWNNVVNDQQRGYICQRSMIS